MVRCEEIVLMYVLLLNNLLFSNDWKSLFFIWTWLFFWLLAFLWSDVWSSKWRPMNRHLSRRLREIERLFVWLPNLPELAECWRSSIFTIFAHCDLFNWFIHSSWRQWWSWNPFLRWTMNRISEVLSFRMSGLLFRNLVHGQFMIVESLTLVLCVCMFRIRLFIILILAESLIFLLNLVDLLLQIRVSWCIMMLIRRDLSFSKWGVNRISVHETRHLIFFFRLRTLKFRWFVLSIITLWFLIRLLSSLSTVWIFIALVVWFPCVSLYCVTNSRHMNFIRWELIESGLFRCFEIFDVIGICFHRLSLRQCIRIR